MAEEQQEPKPSAEEQQRPRKRIRGAVIRKSRQDLENRGLVIP